MNESTTKWFRVTTAPWKCEITPVAVTKETEKTVWYEDGEWNGETIIRKGLKNSDDHQYFNNLTEAKARAREHCNRRYDYHMQRAADFEQAAEDAAEMEYD